MKTILAARLAAIDLLLAVTMWTLDRLESARITAHKAWAGQ